MTKEEKTKHDIVQTRAIDDLKENKKLKKKQSENRT